jgi:hypothetical protein
VLHEAILRVVLSTFQLTISVANRYSSHTRYF